MVLYKQYFAYFYVRTKINSRKLSPLVIGNFLTDVTFLNQMSIFSQKFESALEVTVCYYHVMYEVQSQFTLYGFAWMSRNSLLERGAISEI